MPKQALAHISSSNRKRMGLVTVLLLLVSLVATPAEATGLSPGPSHQQITHIVLISGNASPSQVAADHGLGRVLTYSEVFKGFAAVVPEGRLKALARDPRVIAIEENSEFHIQADPVTSITTSSQVVPTGIRRIGADLSPVAAIDGIDDRVPVIIAVLDTGVDGSHPDLNVNVARSVDCSSGLACVTGIASDDNGHGTHVAGTIAALDNTIGVVGVAPGAELWSIKVCGGSGSCSLSAILLGHEYISANASSIGVTNISLGGQGWSESWRLAIAANVSDGVVVVVAAGNSSRDIYGNDGNIGSGNESIPAAYTEVLTTSALLDIDGAPGGFGGSHMYGVDDSLGSFSNFGLGVVAGNPVTSPGASIDVAAPSVDVLSTAPGGNYSTMSGSSTAAPHVSGVAALHIAARGQANSAAEVYAIRQAIVDDGSPMSGWRDDDADISSDRDSNHEPSVNGAVVGAAPPPPPPPAVEYDAAITGISAPASVIDGMSVDIDATVANSGNAAATIAVEFIDETAGTLIAVTGVYLDAGMATTVSAVWDTTGVPSGSHTLRVVAAVADDINPANDSMTATTYVEQRVLDLSAVISILPNSVVAGDPVTIAVTVVNTGNVEYPTDVPVNVTSDNGTPFDPGDDVLVFSAMLAGPIGPGGTALLSNSVDTGAYGVGTHWLTAELAISDDVAENNSSTVSLVIQAPAAGIVAVVTTDRATYSSRDFAYITVTANLDTGEPVEGASVFLTIDKPKGRSSFSEGVTGVDGSLTIKLRINAKKGGCGIYAVIADVIAPGGLSDSAVHTFSVCS